MRVVHDPGGEERVLATNVERAEGIVRQGIGLMFRRSIPDDYAMVFPFGSQRKRGLHMLFVPFDVDACWLCDGVVQHVTTMSAWTGHGSAVCDSVIEAPAGTFDGVKDGDRVLVEE